MSQRTAQDRRLLRQRPGETLRDMELRWQRANDPKIAWFIEIARESRSRVARMFGVSETAIGNALKRARNRRATPPTTDGGKE